MAFTPLAGRINNLPLVICGPILRRVEPDEVTVWVALKKRRKVWLRVHEYTVLSPPPNLHDKLTRRMDGARTTIRLGEHLHVVAVTAKLLNPDVQLEPGKIYKYNLFFTDADDPPEIVSQSNINLRLPGITAPIDFTIHYDDEGEEPSPQAHTTHHHMPSFSLAPDGLNELRIVHGSCRKPNADGLDAMPAIDDMLLTDNRDPIKRPHYLFLTGDQIYADDVSPILLYMIMDAEKALLGSIEELPLIGKPSLPDNEGKNGNLLPGKRKNPLKNKGKYTSEDLHSHVATAGEYFAMFLLVWSNVLWEDTALPTFEQVYPGKATHSGGSFPGMTEDFYNYKKDFDSLEKFKSTLKGVRRALANVPVYMMFDDHDVTDDWNMTYHWCEEVYGNILGKRLVMNGLLSYVLFQDWGNKPDDYAIVEGQGNETKGQLLLEAVEKWFGQGSKRIKLDQFTSDEEATLNKHLGLPVTNAIFEQKPGSDYHILRQDVQALYWYYYIRRANYDIYFLDGRTRRGYPNHETAHRGKQSHSDIISEDILCKQFGPNPETSKAVNLIVVPTSVISIPAIEIENFPSLIAWIPRGRFKDNVYKYDFLDHWKNQSRGAENLLSFLSERNGESLTTTDGTKNIKSRTILLTGDVHFSAASRMLYHSEKLFLRPATEPENHQHLFVQLASSSFKKQTDETLTIHQMGYKFSNSYVIRLGLEKLKVISHLIYGILLVMFGLLVMMATLVIHIFAAVILQNILDPKGQKSRHFLGWEDPVAKESISQLLIPFVTSAFNSPAPITRFKEIKMSKPGVYEKEVIDEAVEPKLHFPDWQYRIDYIVAENDVREAAPYPTQPLTPPSPGDRKESLGKYLALAKHHRDYAQKWGNGKEVVGVNNVAELFFEWNDSETNKEKFVRQENWWRLQGKNDQVLPLFPLTNYRVSLNFDDPDYPLPDLPKPDSN